MKNKFDKFLLIFLWLIIATLATCFWFNIKFGFNIFSKENWDYLAYMQASQQSVTPLFYISLIVSVFLSIFGLYLLLRPRHRIIKISTKTQHNQDTNISITSHQQASTGTNYFAPVPERPKRLNQQQILPVPTNQPVQRSATHTIPTTAPVPTAQNAFINPTAPEIKWNKQEITHIFESAGYVIKVPPKINGLQTILFAIGTNETIWIGATDCDTATLSDRIATIQQIFSDTLEDIEIDINAFIMNKTPIAPTANILVFDNTHTLDEYIKAHPNPQLTTEEQENFDAFSSYISTVIEYLGRI